MSELPELKRKSESQSSAGKEDRSDGHESNCNPLPEKSSALHQKLQKIADKEDLILNLLKRVMQKSPESKNVSHELSLVEEMLQEVKTELNHVQSPCPQTESAPDDCIDANLLFSEDGNSLVEKKSTQEALWQAERTVKHLRDSPVQTKKSDQTKSDVVEPWESPSTPHATSVVVGKGNTSLLYSTLNIVQIGDNLTQVEGSELHEIFESVSHTLKSSCSKESVMKQSKIDMPLSAGVTDESVAKKPPSGKHSWMQKKEQCGLTLQHSVVNKTVIRYLSSQLNHEWIDVGRYLGLSESSIAHIISDNVRPRDSIYQMLITWKEVKGSQGTYTVLEHALRLAGRTDLSYSIADFHHDEVVDGRRLLNM